jgi:hypothetical protein
MKMIKLPRYLIQLQDVGILHEKTIRNQRVWVGDEKLFNALKNEEEILLPIMSLLQN